MKSPFVPADRQVFAIRKYAVGAASVLLGTLCLASPHVVLANDVEQTASPLIQEEVAPAPATPAIAITELPVTTKVETLETPSINSSDQVPEAEGNDLTILSEQPAEVTATQTATPNTDTTLAHKADDQTRQPSLSPSNLATFRSASTASTPSATATIPNSLNQSKPLGDDYPKDWKTADGSLDSRGYAKGSNASFVAHRLSTVNKVEVPKNLGDAPDWGYNAQDAGISVTRLPAIGSVAWIDDGEKGILGWVATINDFAITYETYEQGNYKTATRLLTAFSGFIHFKDLPKTQTPVEPPKNSTPVTTPVPKIPKSGNYVFTERVSVKAKPELKSPELAYYTKGMSVQYDQVVESDGHQWISYIAASGNRRYIAVKPLTTTATPTPSPAPSPKPSQPVKPVTPSLPSSGSYTFTERVHVQAEAKLTSAKLAYYDKGASVSYDRVLIADGYEWLSYIAASGNRRYIAVKKVG